MNYKQIEIIELSKKIKANGYRPFIAKNGDYGFYTDEKGSRVVSFGIDLGMINISGNYATSNPKECGSGWQIAGSLDINDLEQYFNSSAPHWAVKNNTWKYKTLEQYLKEYQSSSQFVEFKE